MQEQFNELLDQLHGIWLKRRYILVSAWLICPIGWFGVTLIPDSYESTARVFVDTDSILAPLLEGILVEEDNDKKIDLMVKTLLSRTNLERIARMTDLDLQASGEIQYELMIQDLTNDFSILKAKRDNIYTLSIKNKDPLLAKRIVEAALSVFIDNTLIDNREEANQALRFLDNQINDYEIKLKKSESDMASYKKEYSSVLPDYAKGFYGHLNDEMTRLADARLEHEVVNAELAKIKNSLYNRSESTVFSSIYDKRILSLKQKLDSELLNYTSEHPSVKEINTRIWTLKKLKKDEIESFKQMTDTQKQSQFDLDSESPIVQELQIKISELESNAFSLKVKAKSYETRIDTLRGRIDMIPGVEAKLTELSRTYEINKKQYDDLLTRRESAQISNSMEEQTDNIHFKIIDPPRIPTEPVGPKRLLYLIIITLIGFGSGIGLSFLHNQIAPVVLTSKQIAKELNLPVYGESYATISSGIPSKESRKKWAFITSNAILISCLIILLGWYTKDIILLLLSKVS